MNNFEINLQKLQKYPHIQEFLVKYSTDPELLGLFCDKLLRETRDDTRVGFPDEATDALLWFSSLYKPTKELDYEKLR